MLSLRTLRSFRSLNDFCGAKNSFGILMMVYDRVGTGNKFSYEFFVLEGLVFMLQSPKN